MKERPILLSAPMVRAILDGRKTMTRRLVKPQPMNDASGRWTYISSSTAKGEEGKFSFGVIWPHGQTFTDRGRERQQLFACPYGQPGDRLWVRETWNPDPDADHEAWDDHTETYVSWSGCGCRIDGVPPALRTPEHCIYREAWDGSALKWRPAIHMPRWASRITLEITGVRVERLQDISEVDAIAEGIDQCEGGAMDYLANDYAQGYSQVASFRSLWESINGSGSWDDNPFVWVVEFRRIEQEAKAA